MNKKVKIIILSFIFILILVLIGYFIYTNFIQEKEVVKEEKEIKEVKEEKTKIKKLDITKCLNGVEGVTYSNPKESIEDYGITPTINEDKLGVSVLVSGEGLFFKNSLTITSSEKEQKDYYIYINGFEKPIKKVHIGQFGQDSTGISLVYLMEDGSVSYTKLFKKNYDENNNLYFTLNYSSIQGNDYIFPIDGTYDEINDIVNIYNADYSIPNGGGACTVIAATKDGSFYDLSKFMQF